MLAVVIAYHKNDKKEYLEHFEAMLESINFAGHESSIFITLDGAKPDYIMDVLNKFNISVDNVIYSEENVGNYCLKFRLLDILPGYFHFVKFCDFDDRSVSYAKMQKICNENIDYKLICCRSSKWSLFVNYWEKIFSVELLKAIPRFKCFTGGDVIIAWTSFYLCYANNWQFNFDGTMIYYKNKTASKTCREKKPEEYLKLETDSNLIKNILFYAETIESKHIYEKSDNILDIDLEAMKKTINLNDFICRLNLHYKF